MDADFDADDYWEVESNSAQGATTITGYAVCMKESKLKYSTAFGENLGSSERALSVDCRGKTKPVGGGGSIGGNSDSFLSSLFRPRATAGLRRSTTPPTAPATSPPMSSA